MMNQVPLASGRWHGRGSYLHQGESLTIPFECAFDVVAEQVGTRVKGSIVRKADGHGRALDVWITANDTGTYDVSVQFDATRVAGTAKLESYPNLGMLWSEDGRIHVAFSLFELRTGRGCRGFCKTPEGLLSWEVAMDETRRAALRDSANVVSLAPRKRKR
jgi:hypothetical protein